MRQLTSHVPPGTTRAVVTRTHGAALAGAAVLCAALTGCGAEADPAYASAPTAPSRTEEPDPRTDAPTAVDTPGGTSSSLPAPEPAPPCTPDDVVLTAGKVEAAASTRSVRLNVVSATGVDCALTDQARAVLLDPTGVPLEVPVEGGDLPAGRFPVDVLPGDFEGGVSTVVSWRVVPGGPGADPATDCPSGQLAIALGEGAEPAATGVDLTACEAGSLFVQPYDINAG